MPKKHTLQAKSREDKPAAVRREGDVPAVLYGHGVPARNVRVDHVALGKVLEAAGSTSLVTLNLEDDDSEHPVLVREAQFHPLKDRILHVDFYQVRMDEAIRTNVPLNFTGEAPAVKDMGGTLVRSIDEVDLEALPQNLPHDIEVDISNLDDFEKVIHISDLDLPEGVTLYHEDDEVVALVQAPRTQEEIDEELAEEVSEDVEGVEGVAEEDEEAEGEGGEEAAENDSEEAEEKSE